MFRFEQMIHSRMTLREVVQRWPRTAGVVERYGFRTVCHDCDLQTAARRQGVPAMEVILALNLEVFGDSAETNERAACRRA